MKLKKNKLPKNPDRNIMDITKFEKLHRGKGLDSLLYNEDDSTPFTGIAKSWYNNGQIKFEGSYKNGVLNGKATWWQRNGQKELESVYVNGKLEIFCSDSELKNK